MMKKALTTGLLMALSLAVAVPSWACTTVIVGKKASADGSVIVSHSVDGGYDSRISVIPGGKHEPGTMMPVYDGMCTDDVFGNVKTQIGEIPQAAETYTYVHAGYPFMNEYKLIIGEDTWGGRRDMLNTEGLMRIETLQQIALQRTKTARDAIRIMGEFAEKYGYGDGGETLTISDGDEAWVFDIIGPGPLWTPESGTPGAVWVAQRVPDDHIYNSANRSRIGKINLKDSNNFMGSSNIVSVATEFGFYNPETDGDFHWAVAYDNRANVGVYGLSRREWRVFTLLIPSLQGKLDPNLTHSNEHYDFSYKADHKVDIREVMALYRDYYQGTEFDMSKGLAAGPFGNPSRASILSDQRPANAIPGANWERVIGIDRCSYTFVAQTRAWMPDAVGAVAWIGEDGGPTTVFMPLYSGATETSPVLSSVNRSGFETDSAWQAFSVVANFATTRFDAIMENRIQPLQKEFEDNFFALQPSVEATALALNKKDPALAKAYLTDYCAKAAEDVTDTWWKLAGDLFYLYQDGRVEGRNGGYPTWWLEAVGYGTTQSFRQ